ncbi:shikimate dehydrogenase [Amycolatopsis sp. DG1A-15b]|uniref:shikimate dehydrogenase n=1 Tax=Amycolatopsis sp. DG1A-15b TaxID=3052846 RepID=UPI00255BAC91|nr:shikimate dehydrogenase [Amycolatopsis sp. DG1A-15b]WIX93438.1 shikimate dehydrogenase [Amycolatopsis sp. DG1A-15b]
MSSAADAIRAHAARTPPGTVLTGLIGAGIGPSLSPPLHETEARRLGLELVYARFDLDDHDVPAAAVGPMLAVARDAGYRGLNITHPCKQVVLAHLDELSADAAALAAVNTVVFEDGRAIGHNTDWSGFARGLRTGLPGVDLGAVVVLGAGGAGAAVAHGLLTAGAGHVEVFDLDASRAAERASTLAGRFGAGRASAGTDLEAAVGAADGLVHATPTGMAAYPGLPLPAGLLRPDLWVAEVVYRPLETELVRTARALGARVLDGGRMAVFQAAEAFDLFTGAEPDAARMLEHFAALTTPLERQPADVLD